MSARRKIKFASVDEIAKDVRELRGGYTRLGNWNLPQTCWHLDKAIHHSMRPIPDNPPKTRLTQWLARRAILFAGRFPRGVRAPDRVIPAGDTPDSAIDDLLSALVELKNFKGEFAPHPRLGRMNRQEYVRVHLIHCEHHFSLLAPAGRERK